MDVFRVLLLCIAITAVFHKSYCDGCNNDMTSKSAAVRLSNDLLCSYNKNIRPVMNQSKSLTVNTTFYVFNVHLDEEWDVLQMSVQLIMSWKDEFLVWDSSKYDNIITMHELSSSIWIPDIMSYDMGFNGGNGGTEFVYFLPESMVKINSNGLVVYSHRVTFSAQCSANLANWPFDNHNCSFLLGSPVYTVNYVNYSFPKEHFDLDFYNPSREWELSTMHYECLKLTYDEPNVHCLIQYELNIQRFSSMYVSSVIMPAAVISLMRTFTFFITCREIVLRIILLCLFFISELLYVQFLDAKIPNNGEEPVYIVLLYRNSLILTAIALVISIISNEFYKRGIEDLPRDGPKWLQSTSKFLLNKNAITMLTNFNNQGADLLIEKNTEEDTPNRQRDENAIFWKTLSILLDRLFFIITLIISFLNFFSLMP